MSCNSYIYVGITTVIMGQWGYHSFWKCWRYRSVSIGLYYVISCYRFVNLYINRGHIIFMQGSWMIHDHQLPSQRFSQAVANIFCQCASYIPINSAIRFVLCGQKFMGPSRKGTQTRGFRLVKLKTKTENQWVQTL